MDPATCTKLWIQPDQHLPQYIVKLDCGCTAATQGIDPPVFRRMKYKIKKINLAEAMQVKNDLASRTENFKLMMVR
jgi:hypothetical protein